MARCRIQAVSRCPTERQRQFSIGSVRTVVLYAESSAVVTWLFGEPRADAAARAIDGADRVVMSTLTEAECRRAIVRAATLGACSANRAARILAALGALERRAARVQVTAEVLARAGAPFPIEPVRTLDAIHLASIAIVRPAFPRLAVLSLDHRVRDNAAAMGCRVLPAKMT